MRNICLCACPGALRKRSWRKRQNDGEAQQHPWVIHFLLPVSQLIHSNYCVEGTFARLYSQRQCDDLFDVLQRSSPRNSELGRLNRSLVGVSKAKGRIRL